MANATAKVNKGTVGVLPAEFDKRGVETLSAETTYYINAMIGTDATGYLCKGDDTQSWAFAGVVRGREGNPVLPASTAGDGTAVLDVHKPVLFEVILSSVAVTDIGKKVYALFDNQVTLDASATTYANLVGTVEYKVATSIAMVRACYDGSMANQRLGGAKWMAATGTQTLSKMDLNKTIFLQNTATHTVNLPPVAQTQAGDFFLFIKTTADAAAVTLDADGSENIDGSTTLATIDAQYDCARLVSTGAAWIVSARDIT